MLNLSQQGAIAYRGWRDRRLGESMKDVSQLNWVDNYNIANPRHGNSLPQATVAYHGQRRAAYCAKRRVRWVTRIRDSRLRSKKDELHYVLKVDAIVQALSGFA